MLISIGLILSEFNSQISQKLEASPVHESVFEERSDGIDVVLAHLAHVLEHEGQRLKDAVLDVELGHPVLVHETRQDSEGRTGLGNYRDGHCCADTVLALLYLCNTHTHTHSGYISCQNTRICMVTTIQF